MSLITIISILRMNYAVILPRTDSKETSTKSDSEFRVTEIDSESERDSAHLSSSEKLESANLTELYSREGCQIYLKQKSHLGRPVVLKKTPIYQHGSHLKHQAQ